MSSSAEILNEQAEFIKKIQKVQANFKKDGASRKMTLGYHDERLELLDKYWKAFEQNDLRLASMEEVDKTGPYYENQAMENFRRLYTETRHMILQSKHTLEERIQEEESKLRSEFARTLEREPAASTSKFTFDKQPEEEIEQRSDQDMETYSTKTAELLNEQRSNIKAFERAIKKLNIDNITEKWQLEDKIKTISARWESVDRGYWKLDNIMADMTSYDQDYDRLEQMYDAAKTLINKKIWAHNHQEQSAPKIELPIFSGNYAQWVTFKDLFTETVHRNTFISSAQKMQHLKAKLRGEAERLIQHLAISSENYETCWSMLQQRYDNTRLLFAYHANELLNQPTVQQPTASNVKQLHNTTIENLNAISNLHIEIATWGPLLVHILQQKLDNETRQSYVESLENPRELPKIEDFLKFLENKYIALESSAHPARKNPEKRPTNSTFPQSNKNVQHNKNKEHFKAFFGGVITCPKCKQSHGLYNCKEFLNMSANERRTTVSKLGVCKNCLCSHNGNECTSPLRCKTCNKPHNTLLHDDNYRNWNKGQQLNVHVLNNDEEVLLTTVRIEVRTSSGTYTTIRALLDQGSQGTLITERATQLLQLKRHRLGVAIKGVGDGPSLTGKGLVHLSCKAVNSDFTFSTEAIVVNKLTSILPNIPINKNNMKHFEHIQLADPEFYLPDGIDILFGADVYAELIMPGLIKTEGPKPVIAQQTRIGWVISGQTKTIQCHVTLTNLEDMAKFWEQEEIQNNNKIEGSEDSCEQHYKKTTTRLTDGRYQVRLPLKPEIQEELGTSKKQAVAQFKQLERKMNGNPTFGENYKQFMREYLELGHMRKCDAHGDKNKLQYFLPHHGVIRENAVTTKLRVVFNASAKTSSNRSLNDLMEGGPNLQADLQGILLQWRKYQYVLTGDIEKMYRYLAMHPDDQPLQKIIWRWSPHHRLEEYQLCTVTYGTKAAPFLALRTLKQLAIDEGDKYPLAKMVLNNNFFMDDAIFGGNTIAETKQTRDQLIQLLKSGGLNIRKWASNEPSLVEDLPGEMRNPQNFEFTESTTSKALGLSWNPKSDEFVFTPVLKPSTTKNPSKRQILSEISTLFDPLGWLAPITVKAKILFQKVWKYKLEWEDEVPEEIQKEWNLLRAELTNMQPFRIKRWLGCDNNRLEIELHAYCDASEKAYACVVYSAVRDRNGEYQINIAAAKTKVAPLQQTQTLPRLELCGAQLLATLIDKVKQYLNRPNMKVTAWTDSMVVLGWLKGDESRWKSYVANRVKNIKKIVPAENWRHVKSEDNPADCASRGLLPSQLQHFSLWWTGPEWLQNMNIPPEVNNKNIPEITTDVDVKVHTATIPTRKEQNIISEILEKQDSMSKAARVVAWVSRFITMARERRVHAERAKQLTLAEIRAARSLIIKQVQNEHYKQEIRDLQRKGKVANSCSILKLNPFIDDNQMLRVGGRLQNSWLPEETKHPIIVPQTSRLTELLIREAHLTTLHGGARLTLATLRQRYWIVGGNNNIKKHIRQCVKCCRYRNNNTKQLMGSLPSARTTPSPPFYHTGVDFTGAVDVKINKGRGVKTSKGYIAIFICMVTKAVHLELVTDLSTPTFIMALKRMAARRGCPRHIYSDNGTNFVGAERVLYRQLQSAQKNISDSCHQEITNMGLEWHFNAPSWPTAGGLWEAAVKSMKYHLKRVLGEQKLTYEEFATLLTEIEACMNSRPLCPLTEDVDDLECLTPGHFLIGRPLISIPEEDLTETSVSPLNRWRLTKQMHQQFWKRWSAEYLHQLQIRSKWNKETKNISVGDIVLIKEDNMPPVKWAMARVQELHPGRDGLVRVVTLKVKGNILKRPITKLIPLPTNDNQNLKDLRQDRARNSNKQKQDTTQPSIPEQRQTRTNRRKKINSSFLCILLALATLITPTRQSEDVVNIQPFEENKPMYFDNLGTIQNIHDHWKIVTYYNMTSYWLGIKNVIRLVQHLDSRCLQFPYRSICDVISTELSQEVEELKNNNILLRPTVLNELQTRRNRRGLINGIGYLANSLFGVLDERFAEKYTGDIEALHKNEHHLLALIKNQTSIVEAQNNIIARNKQVLEKHLNLIEEHLNMTDSFFQNINNNLKHDENIIYFNMMALSANIIITKLRTIQQMLLDTAINIHHGQIDTRLLTQNQLIGELKAISGQLPKNLYLPVENIQEHLANVYKLLEVRWRAVENYFIVEIVLPLTSNSQFKLYRPIAIATQKHNKTITMKTKTEYIAINIRQEVYMALTDKEISSCVEMGPSSRVCNLNKPTINMKSNRAPCEISVITNTTSTACIYVAHATCDNQWIELHRPNTWLFSCCEVCAFRVICNGQLIARSAHSAGIITAGHGCIIKHDDATLYTQRFYENRIDMSPNIIVPSTDLEDINRIATNNILTPITAIEREVNDRDITELQNRIQQLKEQSEITDNISTHDAHQYAVSYTSLALILVLGVAAGCTYMHWRRNKRHLHPKQGRSQNSRGTEDNPVFPEYRIGNDISTNYNSKQHVIGSYRSAK